MPLLPLVVPLSPEPVDPSLDPAIAYAQTLPAIEAVTDPQKVAINVNVPTMVERIVVNTPKLASLSASAQEQLRQFDPSRFTRLRTLALALGHAHAVYLTGATRQTENQAALGESGATLRERLFADAGYMVKRGLLDARRLAPVRNLTGYRNVAYDLRALVSLFRDTWPVVSTKSAVTEQELEQAESIALRLLQSITVREQHSAEQTPSAAIRHKAYSLLFHEYDAIRRVVTFLRWDHGDADEYAPSLFAGRRAGSKAAREDEPQDEPQDEPDDGGQESEEGAPPGPTPAGQPKVPFGQPGGSPFIG